VPVLALANGAPVAIIPVAGERVTLEEVPLYERIDALLRQAASGHDVTLQPVDVTKAHLGTLRDSGIDCNLDDRVCLAKIAVLGEVARLLVPVARREGSVFHMRVLVVDGTGAGREVKGDVTLSDDNAADRRLATALVRAALVTTLDAAPVMARAPAEKPPEEAPPEAPAAPLPVLGLSVIGGSAAIALVGGVGAAIVNEQLGTPEPYADRQTKMAIGQACLVGVGAGFIGAAFGGLLVALGE
jgi:hypothetical protein